MSGSNHPIRPVRLTGTQGYPTTPTAYGQPVPGPQMYMTQPNRIYIANQLQPMQWPVNQAAAQQYQQHYYANMSSMQAPAQGRFTNSSSYWYIRLHLISTKFCAF